MESPLARRGVSGFSCSTGAEGTLHTWSVVREDKRGSGDPVDDFKSGTRVGGNKGSTGEGFRPVDMVGKGGEVAILDSSLIGNRVERPPLLRRDANSSFNQDLGVSVLPPRTSNRPSLHGREVHPC